MNLLPGRLRSGLLLRPIRLKDSLRLEETMIHSPEMLVTEVPRITGVPQFDRCTQENN